MARSTTSSIPTSKAGSSEDAQDGLVNLNRLIDDLDAIVAAVAGNNIVIPTVLSIGSTDTNIASTAFTFRTNGVPERKAAVAAGTAIGAQTVTADKWALYRLSIAAGGAITVTPAAGNVAGYATEAAAIAALPATPANQADVGYITVKTKAATAWVAATDALAGGSSGNPASATNYYPTAAALTAAGVTGSPFLAQKIGTRGGVALS